MDAGAPRVKRELEPTRIDLLVLAQFSYSRETFSCSERCESRLFSKLKLQRQLDRARATDLVQGIEGSAAEITVVETLRENLVGHAEARNPVKVRRWSKIGVVQDVEQFCPELKL